MRERPLRRSGVAVLLLAVALVALAQTQGVVAVKQKPPAYPGDPALESLWKQQQQGNVLLTGRIDAHGRVQGVAVVAATQKEFEPAALHAVREWEFKPATRDGKPIEVFLNAVVRFRVPGERRGDIPQPILGDLAISPADAAGNATAPEGFPLRLGKDPALRAETVLDIAPSSAPRTLAVRVEARSPSGKTYPVFQPPIFVPAHVAEFRIPVIAKIGPHWEEGVWALVFTVEGAGAGYGQFWLARDPATFRFHPQT